MTGEIESFYNEFSQRFVDDIVGGNDRVARQLRFLSNAVPRGAKRILVIGSGSGQCAYFLASRVARSATVTAVDISSQNLRLATTLFSHPRIDYRKVDVVSEPIDGTWDAIVLPDVYEHIALESRPVLHARLNLVLAQHGRLLLTVPTPGKQRALRASGRGLQIIDEAVTLEDLSRLAGDVGGTLTYFNMISVWETNDYIHALVERGAERVRTMSDDDYTPVKGWPCRSLWTRGADFVWHRLSAGRFWKGWRRRHIQRKLSRRNSA